MQNFERSSLNRKLTIISLLSTATALLLRSPVPIVMRVRVSPHTGYGSQHSADPSALFNLFPGWRILSPATAFAAAAAAANAAGVSKCDVMGIAA